MAAFNGVSPYIFVDGGVKAVAFYEEAFGAEKVLYNVTPDGKLMHASLAINGGTVMVSDDMRPAEGRIHAPKEATSAIVHLETTDAQPWWDRAVKAGCTVVMPLEDQFWGDRYGQLQDPFGHVWSIASPSKKK